MSGIQTNTRVAEKDIEIDDVVSSNIVVNVDQTTPAQDTMRTNVEDSEAQNTARTNEQDTERPLDANIEGGFEIPVNRENSASFSRSVL